MKPAKKRRVVFHTFTTLVIVNFFFSLAHASTGFVHSSFLSQFFSAEGVSALYLVYACTTLATLFLVPLMVSAIGARALLISAIPVLQVALLFFGISEGPIVAVLFFLMLGVGVHVIKYILDLYVEGSMKSEAETGGARSVFLTSMNLAFFIGPLFIALLVVGNAFAPLYAFATIILLPVFALTLTKLHYLPVLKPKHNPVIQAVKTLWCCNTDARYAVLARFVYGLFNFWISVYVPLFLFQQAGLSWQLIGLITALALLPYSALEIPLGFIADKFIGEQEMMVAGFGILAIAVSLLSIIPVSLTIFWTLAFITTRIGGALVEVSVETHFFKAVSEDDSGMISVFRMTSPIAVLVGPLVALAFIPLTGLSGIFFVFGVVLAVGMIPALRITDSR